METMVSEHSCIKKKAYYILQNILYGPLFVSWKLFQFLR